MIELTPEEIQALKDSGPEIAKRLKSLREDLAAGLPVQPLIDTLEQTEKTRRYMLQKYGRTRTIGQRPGP